MNVTIEKYGVLKNGKDVDLISLITEKLVVQVINYGSRMVSICTPNKKREMENILLNYRSLSEYENDKVYLGCVLGRCANRIKNSEFEIQEKKYKLPKTEGKHHLHGGKIGFDKKLWDYQIVKGKDSLGVKLTYVSVAGEEGYPGNLSCTADYTINNKNELLVQLNASSDSITPINLSIHPYFNLTGSTSYNILSHKFKLNAPKILEVDSEGILTGEIIDVSNTEMDLTSLATIEKKVKSIYPNIKNRGGFDHSYLFDDKSMKNEQIEVIDDYSGRIMKMQSSAPLIHFYSGNYLPLGYQEGIIYRFKKYAGFALEPQFFSKINGTLLPFILLNPDQKFECKNKFSFECIK
ncbi:MAG: galactose mutarotase [Bacteroidetes bacterium]|nr:galactose mutarotase [Bacteroidota bacterium]